MRTIIITIPTTAINIETIDLVFYASMTREVIRENVFLRTINQEISFCLT
ncbi:MAG: hypothetical protein JST75_06860 [Bacteroidetes bacterium]|nr:hypothetical protein [Bacteroidota bacterium]